MSAEKICEFVYNFQFSTVMILVNSNKIYGIPAFEIKCFPIYV